MRKLNLYKIGKAHARSMRNNGQLKDALTSSQRGYEESCRIIRNLIKDKMLTAPILHVGRTSCG